MRKIVALLLLLSLLLSSSICLADITLSKTIDKDFSFRDGVTFGMTMQQVRAKEKKLSEHAQAGYGYIYPKVAHTGTNGHYVMDSNVLRFTGDILPISLRNGSLQNTADLFYVFKNGKLDEIVYEWGSNEDEWLTITNTIYKQFKDKYGSCVFKKVDASLFSYDLNQGSFLDDPVSWLVKYNDCYCLITLYDFTLPFSYNGPNGIVWAKNYETYLVYTKLTETQIEKYITDKQAEEEAAAQKKQQQQQNQETEWGGI